MRYVSEPGRHIGLASIVKKRLILNASLYNLLLILSVTHV